MTALFEVGAALLNSVLVFLTSMLARDGVDAPPRIS